MIQEWYLVIVIFVLQGNEYIDERHLYAVKQEDHIVCEQEANARIKLFTPYIGKDHIRRFSSTAGTRECYVGGCTTPTYDDNNPNAGTYQIGLNGKLIGFSVGCEQRERYDFEDWPE